jgi:long-subunit acyl-CoA synthetase (AMP-forming)
VHTECKVIILDPERASSLETTVSNISEAIVGGIKFLVMDTTDKTRRWQGMEFFNDAVDLFPVACANTKAPTTGMGPEDNATIIFTSGICLSVYVRLAHRPTGTTGLPKGVLSTQRQFLTNVLNVSKHEYLYFMHT